MENLVFIGDKVTFTQDLRMITSINAVLRDYYSTSEANLSSNANLQFERVSSRFRLSFDDQYYSDWYNLKDFEISNVKSFSNVYVSSSASTNVEVEFKLLSVPSGWDEDSDFITISNVTVSSNTFTANAVTVVSSPPANVSAIGNDQGLEYQKNFHYDPYDMGQLERLQDDISFMTNEIYGHEVDYVKVTSNSDKGTDFILREYNLFNVKSADVKCIKVLVPNNEFPDSKFDFNMFEVGYPDVFEIHVVDSYFKKIFGAGYFPQQHDFLYFPIINRMYEVASTYIHRDFNMNPLYWKLTLTKYEKKQNIIWEDESQKQAIEDSVKGLDELFGVETGDESKDLINENQLRLNEESLDYMRSYINSGLTFTENKIENYFTLVSDSQYELNSLYTKYATPKLAVTYKNKYSVASDSTTMAMMWAKFHKETSVSYNITTTLFSAGVWEITLTTGNFPTFYNVGDLVTVFQKTSSGKVHQHLFEISSINVNRDVIQVTLFDSTEEVDVSKCNLITRTVERPLLVSGSNSYDSTTRVRSFTEDSTSGLFKVFVADQHTLNIRYFGTNYSFKFTNKLSDNIYYGIMLSFNLKHRQLGAYLYKIRGGNISAELEMVDYYNRLGFENTARESDNVLNVLSSPVNITNIRVLSEHIEQDLHSSYLSRNIIDNNSKAIVVDNALDNLDLRDIK